VLTILISGSFETDEGITGYGEVSSALYYYRLGPSHAYDINAYLGPALIGQDPLMIPALVDRMDQVLRGGRQAKSGVEMALWDIAGKAAGLPVYRLLGGKARSAVPLNWTVGFCEPEQAAAEAARYVEQHGIRSVRLKIGRAGDADARSCAPCEAAGPTSPFAWTLMNTTSLQGGHQAIRRIENTISSLSGNRQRPRPGRPRRVRTTVGTHRWTIGLVAPRCHRCHSGAGGGCV
jgi:L-alanine-DL-glutamate epimerase-like enolase superfamily enzyme